ncbi:MAG: ankyrin repeat domain-containing protein [Alphaproteobacteria bacterium]|jgi:ankyrin repeat protein|nr:ankyrin repeat domain-containing protein [Alphaproteobacteria bacterium]
MSNKQTGNSDSQHKVEIRKLIFVSIIIVILLFTLYVLTQKDQPLKSYDKKEGNVYTLLEISDEDFLNKIRFGKTSEIQQMLSSGANVKAADNKGQNAFTVAAIFNGKPEVARILKQGGVDINAKDSSGYTPLMKAILAGGNSTPFVKELIKLGADVNLTTNLGTSTLSVAAGSSSDEEIIEALIKAGADVNYKNKDGSTPIIIAAKINTNPKVIESLLNHGAKASRKELGRSAYSLAISNPSLAGNEKLINRLRKLA